MYPPTKKVPSFDSSIDISTVVEPFIFCLLGSERLTKSIIVTPTNDHSARYGKPQNTLRLICDQPWATLVKILMCVNSIPQVWLSLNKNEHGHPSLSFSSQKETNQEGSVARIQVHVQCCFLPATVCSAEP